MEHTPGPWVAKWDQYGGYDCMSAAWTIKSTSTGQEITVVDEATGGCYVGKEGWVDGHLPETTAANAALIAAAPELLEVLEAEVAAYPSGDSIDPNKAAWLSRGRAAIAKARGLS